MDLMHTVIHKFSRNNPVHGHVVNAAACHRQRVRRREGPGRQAEHAACPQGELLISNQESRSQSTNLGNAMTRLQEVLDEAAESIKPIESDPEKVKKIQKREKAVRPLRSPHAMVMLDGVAGQLSSACARPCVTPLRCATTQLSSAYVQPLGMLSWRARRASTLRMCRQVPEVSPPVLCA